MRRQNRLPQDGPFRLAHLGTVLAVLIPLAVAADDAPRIPAEERGEAGNPLAETPTSLDKLLAGRRLRSVYETTFDHPLRVVRESELVEDGRFAREPADGVAWVLEGPGSVRVVDGRLHMECADGHAVLWNRRTFPGDFVAEWDFRPHHLRGLAILFFSANAQAGGHVHQVGMPAREGVFRNYTKGAIDCYHTSYFATFDDGRPRGDTHIRKNQGFYLVAEGPSRIDATDGTSHRIRVAKFGTRILLEVDGEVSIDWTDPGEAGESKRAPYGSGQIGLRQMKHTIEGSYDYFKVHAIE